MSRADLVVAIRDEHDTAGRGRAPADETQGVECRFVSPMDVLDDHHRTSGELPEQCGQQPMPSPAFLEQRRERRHVAERCERPRRRQRVACAPQDADVVGTVLDERTREARLPDAGLAPDQRKPARGLRLCEARRETREQVLALDQLHPRTLSRRRRIGKATTRKRRDRTGR